MPRRKVVRIDEGKPRRMTPQLLSELIAVHSSCVRDQEGRCPLALPSIDKKGQHFGASSRFFGQAVISRWKRFLRPDNAPSTGLGKRLS